jgi:hypothetical protein
MEAGRLATGSVGCNASGARKTTVACTPRTNAPSGQQLHAVSRNRSALRRPMGTQF